jgi:hypothetical protein
MDEQICTCCHIPTDVPGKEEKEKEEGEEEGAGGDPIAMGEGGPSDRQMPFPIGNASSLI